MLKPSRRPARDERHYHRAATLTRFGVQRFRHRDRLQPDAEPAARDAAVPEKRGQDTLDSGRRNDERLAARPEGGDAEAHASRVEHRPALLGAREAEIEHDVAVDAAAGAGRPLRPGDIDDAQTRAHAAGAVGTESERQRTRLRLAARERLQLDRPLEAKQCDVRARVAAGKLRLYHGAVGDDELELLALRERLLGSDRRIRPPERGAEMPRLGDADGGDRAAHDRGALGERAGKLLE